MLYQLYIVSFFHVSDFTLPKENNNSIIYQWYFMVEKYANFHDGTGSLWSLLWVHEMMTFARIS